MLVTIPLGEIEDTIAAEKFLRIAFLCYVLVGLLYVIIGLSKSLPLLILTLILHGIISAMVFVSARTYLKKRTLLQNSSTTVGFFNMSIFGFYALGMFLGGWLQTENFLNFMFVSVILTSFVAWVFTKKKLLSSVDYLEKFKVLVKQVIDFKRKNKIYYTIFQDLHQYGFKFYYILGLIFFLGLVESLTMIFIPIFALKLHLTLSQISFLIGVMYVPYVFSFIFGEIADRYERLSITIFGLFFAATPMLILYYTTQNFWIGFLSSMISLGIALVNPAIEGMANAIVPLEKR